MFSRTSLHLNWEQTHTIQQLAVFNDPNLSHRDSMEDTHFYKESENGDFIFGVLDGHNGQAVVEAITKKLPSTLLANISKTESNNEQVEVAFRKTFLELDGQMASLLTTKAQQTGSTCTVCLVRRENGQKVLYTANIGDTQAFLYQQDSNNTSTELTTTHRASNEGERKRVKDCGSFVSMDRIEGQLEVFRTFGDLKMKKKGVIAEPSISKQILSSSPANPNYQIVIACDGLWDYVKKNEIDNCVHEFFDNAGQIAQELKNIARTSRSKDNITVMTVNIQADN